MRVIGREYQPSPTVFTRRCNHCDAALLIEEYDVQLETYTERDTAAGGPLAGKRVTLTRQYHYVRCTVCGVKLTLRPDAVPRRVQERLQAEYWSAHGPE